MVRTLDVDGVLDVDGAAGSAIDNVTIGATTSAAGTFSTMTTDSRQISTVVTSMVQLSVLQRRLTQHS